VIGAPFLPHHSAADVGIRPRCIGAANADLTGNYASAAGCKDGALVWRTQFNDSLRLLGTKNPSGVGPLGAEPWPEAGSPQLISQIFFPQK